MKSQHLDYRHLCDHLVERSLIDPATIQHVLHQCNSTGALLPEILVQENLISDWELSRVCAELFGLAFLPVDIYPPSDEALEGLDSDFLRQYALVPLDRFGDLLTIAIPGVIPSSVLDGLKGELKIQILPVVGSVQGNRTWLGENLPESEGVKSLQDFEAALPTEDASWANIFDEGEQAVQLELNGPEGESEGFGDLDLGGSGGEIL